MNEAESIATPSKLSIEGQKAEIARLREKAQSREAASPWQPRVISDAFCTARADILPAITMQGWIDLDAARSPFISRQELAAPLEQITEALRALNPVDLDRWLELIASSPACAVQVERAIREIIDEAWDTIIKMRHPEAKSGVYVPDDGFGWWLPVYAALLCRLSRAEALSTPVRQAHAILAGFRRNEGWFVTGRKYSEIRQSGADSEISNLKSQIS